MLAIAHTVRLDSIDSIRLAKKSLDENEAVS